LAALSAAVLSASTARADYQVRRVASGLNQPTYVTQAPGDDTNLYIVERSGPGGTLGDIVRYNPVTQAKSTFLDLSGPLVQDGGAFVLAFHPDYATNGRFYVTSMVGATNHLDEYRVVNGNPAFQRTLLQYDNLRTQHTITWTGFKPGAVGAERNWLYVNTGDGGVQADEGGFINRGQNPTTVMGKVLRLDVDPAAPDAYPSDPNKNFAIPAANPFAADTTGKLKEVFMTGFRSPWRGSFDRQTGDLYVGDVGFNTKEEINFNRNDAGFNSGRDYGWALREGTIANPTPGRGGASPGSLNPIYERNHPDFSSITGGYVYRGPVPELRGKYFFADFVTGKILSFEFDRDTDPALFNGSTGGIGNLTDMTALLRSRTTGGGFITNPVSFGEDHAGNLYIVKFGDGFFPPLGTGEIYQIVAVPEPTFLAPVLILAGGLLRRRKPAATPGPERSEGPGCLRLKSQI
jgi:hypothetical protein